MLAVAASNPAVHVAPFALIWRVHLPKLHLAVFIVTNSTKLVGQLATGDGNCAARQTLTEQARLLVLG